MYYVGLDVHAKRSSMCILDDNGKLVKHLEVKGAWQRMLQVVDEQVPKPFAICYEASCGYGYLHDQLARRAERVTVGHPGQIRLIFCAKRKNDRIDGGKLAKLLYLDAVPAVHVPGVDVRAWRGLINYRRKLVGRRAAVKTQIRAHLRGLGIAVGVKGGLWTKKGLAWLAEQAMSSSSADGLRRDVMLDDLAALEERVRKVERELDRIGRAHPGVTLLRTIPGVGPRTAVAHVDDVRRFARVKQVGSYFGLVPCQDASADRNRLGHITKDGPAPVRWLVAEAAWQGRRRSPRIRAFFDRVMRDDPGRKKIALVATANHLTRVMTAMLRSGEVWREEGEASSPAATKTTTQTTTRQTTTAPQLKAQPKRKEKVAEKE
jgi:transposase